MPRNGNFKDLTNRTFGYLTAICVDEERTTPKRLYWFCRCICGNTRSLQTHQLTSGKVTSCGCKNTRVRSSPEVVFRRKRMRSIYSSMIARCHNPNCIGYKYYGYKGITVCDEWKNSFISFAEWAESNGYNDTLSIDRIDNSKGYCPSNCRWIPLSEQAKNMTTTVQYTHNGETHNLKDWCHILNFDYCLAKARRQYAKRKKVDPSFEFVFSPPKFTRS